MSLLITCDHCEKNIVSVDSSSMEIVEDYELGTCLKFATGRGSNICEGAVNIEDVPTRGTRIFCQECKKAYQNFLRAF